MITISNNTYSTKMLGVVTLYNPEPKETASNINRYICDLDTLIIWDNSPLEKNVKDEVLSLLGDNMEKVLWHGDGKNYCIAPAINHSWQYAKEHGYDLLLIMDQDSRWEDFASYRLKIEELVHKGIEYVYKPYIFGDDSWKITQPVVFRRRFINSGTVFPISVLNKIGGADEIFALDALDTDLSIRTIKEGVEIACLTDCHLIHTIGRPHRSRFLRLYTNNYGRFRTYSITKSHIICYRKNHKWMNCSEKKIFFKEILMWKFIRIILVENDKIGRMKMFVKGIKDGLAYKL